MGKIIVLKNREMNFEKKILNWQLLRVYFWALIILMFSYSVLRACFLYWNWNQFRNMNFIDITYAFFIGLRFDLCAVGLLFLPAFLLTFLVGIWLESRTWKKIFLFSVLLIQIPFWILNYIDIEFFNFIGRRVTLAGLFIFTEAKGKMTSFFSTYGFWIFIICLMILGFIYLLMRFIKVIKFENDPKNSKLSYALTHFLFLIPLIVFARGGIQLKPIDFVFASVFTSPVLNNLVLNSTFSIIKSADKDKISPVQFYAKEEEYFSFLNGYKEKKSLLEGHRPLERQNVVIFILESFAFEFMGDVNNQKGYTPFLDDIAKKGLLFKNAFANGRRSIEGISSIMAGIPAMMSEPFISSEFSSNYFLGAGSLLEPLGYETSFFHGGHNGTMYFDKFINSAGIPKYFGASEYPGISDDNDKVWGIFDEPFLKFFGEKLGAGKKPFFSALFTLSSHHPYTVPEALKGRFIKGPLEILESIQYTDYALKIFFETYKNQKWFKNTLFIFTADHTQKNLLPEFNNEIGRYKVPILFYHPHFKWPQVDLDLPVQHIDILPSVMDFLNLPMKQKILLGESVFKPDHEKTVTLFQDGNYFLINKKNILFWNQRDPVKIFDSTDWNLKTDNLELEKKEDVDHLERKLKASIQYFNKGLWDNRLYFPNK